MVIVIIKNKRGTIFVVEKKVFKTNGKQGRNQKRWSGIKAKSEIIEENCKQNNNCNQTISEPGYIAKEIVDVKTANILIKIKMNDFFVVRENKKKCKEEQE